MAKLTSARPTSLRNKFVRILLVVSCLMGIATTGIVVLMSAQASEQYLRSVQQHIEQGIISKGRVLTQNHALAMRGLATDNAFLDMQRLVARAVHEDADLTYGVFVSADKEVLATSRRGSAIDDEDPPDKLAWRELGLEEGELLVRELSVKRALRHGEDLLEVAVPVITEDGENLGTIRYGLSTARMHAALEQAKLDSESRRSQFVAWLVMLVSLVAGLGLILSRAQAVRVTQPIGELTRAAEALATGDRTVRVNIKSGDELEILGASFNRMVEELTRSYDALETMNRTLEQKVLDRTAELALRNRDMRLVLDNVDQGFISLSPDGKVAAETSGVVASWFGEVTPQQDFWSYIGRASRAFAVTFQLAWAQLEDGFMPLEVCVAQLPEQLTRGNRTWSFRYLPFFDGGKLAGVLLVVADITERLGHEREEAEQRELMQGFMKLMLDRSGFTNFLRDASSMVRRIVEHHSLSDDSALKHTLHTLKGNSGVMGLTVVARLCHTLETQLAEERQMNQRTVNELAARWKTITEHVARFVGTDGQRIIEIPVEEYTELVSKLSSTDSHSEVLHQLLSWQLEPADRALSRLADQGRSLARRLGKDDLAVEVHSNGVRLDPEDWSPFFSDMIHVVRNAVDHGIESREERLKKGKPANGTLSLKVAVDARSLCFEVTDDGRGIQWDAIAEKAKKLGLPFGNAAEHLAALCAEGISSTDVVNEVSGRGVGMSAFKQRVSTMGGQLELRSVANIGTTWIVRFPWPLYAA